MTVRHIVVVSNLYGESNRLNALKTSILRIRGSEADKKELEEMGEDITDLAEGSSKLRDEVKALSGVDIMDGPNTYRDMYDIMVDLAEVWDRLSDTQSATILEDIAGKRNASVIASIIQNIKDMQGAYDTATHSTGALSDATEIYLNSIEGKMAQAKAVFEDISQNVLSSDLLKFVLDTLKTILGTLNGILGWGDAFVMKATLAITTLVLLTKAQTAMAKSTLFTTGEPNEASLITPVYAPVATLNELAV